jgi:hypothetical protein
VCHSGSGRCARAQRGLKEPTYGLAAEGKKRWCAGCGAAKGAVSLKKQQMCEGCGLKRAGYGLAAEGKVRWCAGCGVAAGAVRTYDT